MSYRVEVRRRFSAEIELPGQSPPRRWHDYLLVAAFEGDELDENGFLLDIDEAHRLLDELTARWDGALLNERPEFMGEAASRPVLPTLESSARIAAQQIARGLDTRRLAALTVTLHEAEQEPWPGPSASFRMSLGGSG